MVDYQSNVKLQDDLIHNWKMPGEGVNTEGLKKRLEAVQRKDIIDLLPAFTQGSIVSILNPPTQPPKPGE